MDSLISFKAGLANLIDGVVTPDPRRGEVRVVAVEADGLLHFQWRERKSLGPSGPEIDIVIFPEEADFIKVCLTHRGTPKTPSGRAVERPSKSQSASGPLSNAGRSARNSCITAQI